MPDFLTRRNGTWHFARRVPVEFARFDSRGVVKHSTRIRISNDRAGRRAVRVAEQFNEKLEQYWRALADGSAKAKSQYDMARHRARAMGFEYLENEQLLSLPAEKYIERLEALALHKVANDHGARTALLGLEKTPPLRISGLFSEYESLTANEVRDLSKSQLRIWRTGRLRAAKRFQKVVGDKPLAELTDADAIDYVDWWRGRVGADGTEAKTANKDIGQLSRMLKEVSLRRRLKLPDIFRGLRLKGEVQRSRSPFERAFIENSLLAPGALDGLNEDARFVLYVVAETGMRPSEVVNLQTNAIHLDAPIPYVSVLPDGRRLKTVDSRRDIPLTGLSLAVMKKRPNGFERYRDKSSQLSATLNKFLAENGLRPTSEHTVYSLRHSFKDRLLDAEAPDSLIDSLMGHRTYKPKYGRGPSLELKLKFLQRIALRSSLAI